MILEIDLNSDVAIYQQIRDRIVLGLVNGELEDGELLPSVRQLAADLGVNFMTVNKAYALLKEEGFLKTDRRFGSRVVRPQGGKNAMDLPAYREKLELLLAEGLARSSDKEAFRLSLKARLDQWENGGI